MEDTAVEQALEAHGAAILHLAYAYLHDRSEAEDVLQDTLVQLLSRAPAFESGDHERAWLLRVAANLCKNRLKAPWRRHEALPEDYPAQGIPEESVALFQAVCSLPVKYREVIHLFYYEDYTTAQIAQVLGKWEGTVRSLLNRGREKLRQIWKEGADGTL